MQKVEIERSDDVFSFLELRCDIDNLRIKEGIELFLTELATAKMDKRGIKIDGMEGGSNE